MNITIDGVEYLIPAEEETLLLRQLQAHFIKMYEGLDGKWRLLLKPVARELLRAMEKKAREQYGDEVAMRIRPPHRKDPNLHLMDVSLALSQKGMEDVSIGIATADHTIANISLSIPNQGESGGQMALNGDIGVWEDNSAQIP
jgi:hypothetical protein